MNSSSGQRRISGLSSDELQLLRERARVAAKRKDTASNVEFVEVLEIHSRGQTFALPLSYVEGIADLISVAAVPRAPHIVRGLVSFRGEVLIGLELSSLMGGGTRGIADLRRIIAISAGGMKLAILAEKVVSVRAVHLESFHPDRLTQQSYVVGTDENFVSLLDPAALVNHTVQTLGRGGS